MGDGSRSRPSRRATVVEPVVYSTTLSAKRPLSEGKRFFSTPDLRSPRIGPQGALKRTLRAFSLPSPCRACAVFAPLNNLRVEDYDPSAARGMGG